MRRFVLIAVLLLAVAGGAGAGTADRLQARLTAQPRALAVGTPWIVRVVLRRGGRPLAAARAFVWFAGAGQTRVVRATALGGGRYRARVSFPAEGRWNVGVAVGRERVRLARPFVGPRPIDVVEPFAVALSASG